MSGRDVPPDDLSERQFAALQMSMAYEARSYSHAEIRRRVVAEYADRLLTDPSFARSVDAALLSSRSYRAAKEGARLEVVR